MRLVYFENRVDALIVRDRKNIAERVADSHVDCAQIREPGIFSVLINGPTVRVCGLVVDVITLWNQTALSNVAQWNRKAFFEDVETLAIGDENALNVDLGRS